MKRRAYVMKRFVPLVLAMLLCAGCQNGDGQASGEQGLASRYDADQDAFAQGELTYIIAQGADFTISSEEGEVLYAQDMTPLELSAGDEDLYWKFVPTSRQYDYRYTGEEAGARQGISIASYVDGRLREYGVTGNGMETIHLDCAGQALLHGKNMQFEVFLPVQGNGLGERGCMRFYGSAAERAEFTVEKDQVGFQGVAADGAAISYSGDNGNAAYIDLQLMGDSGVLDFSQVNEGKVTLKEDGQADRDVMGTAEDPGEAPIPLGSERKPFRSTKKAPTIQFVELLHPPGYSKSQGTILHTQFVSLGL